MKRSRSNKKLPEVAARRLPFAPRQEPDPLGPGDVVMLPNGGLAAIEKIVGSDAYVIEWQKQIGRGPWIFPIAELVPVAP